MVGRRFSWLMAAALVMIANNALAATSSLDCSAGLARVYTKPEIIANFKELTAQHFVGQQDAYDSTLVALNRFKPHGGGGGGDVLVLHYVGASGTGKTLLANLVQRSFFHLNQCPENSAGANVLGFRFCARAYQNLQIHMQDGKTCGVAYVDFLNIAPHEKGQNEEEEGGRGGARLEALKSTVRAALALAASASASASASWHHHHHSPAIIFLDNFNLCKHECDEFMNELVSTRRFEGRPLPASTSVVFLITSDLSQEGLRLVPGEDRALALKRVLRVVEETWGEDSLWNDRAHVVPFAPYSDADLVKILDMAVREVEREVRASMDYAMHDERERTQRSSVEWTGRFKFHDRDKQAVMSRLYREITSRNARAFEKIKGKLLASATRPVPIEDVLVRSGRYRPTEAQTWHLKDLWGGIKAKYVHGKQSGLAGLEYQQDVVFRAVDDSRFVVCEVDDIHAFYDRAASGSSGSAGAGEL